MWDPEDPVHLTWDVADGLVSLIDAARLHLFREQWWRDTGEWVGPQAPHRAA